MTTNLFAAGERIKSIRKKHRYSMAAFAKLVGNSSASTVNNWEKGNNLPKRERLEKIAILGNTTVSWIKYGTFTEYVLSLLVDINPSIKLSDDQLHKLITTLQQKSISYEEDLDILATAKNLFPTAFDYVYEKKNTEVFALIGEEATDYFIEKDPSYRIQLLPVINQLAKDETKFQLLQTAAELLIEEEAEFLSFLKIYSEKQTDEN
ncbi:helix-turn-helix domain-containing protein [Enterococcus sp. LJL128]